MGGDHGPPVTVPACLAFLESAPDARVILVGMQAPLEAALAKAGSASRERISVHAATEVVDMDEPPADALRKKKDSSMRVAINLVKDGTANACVSAGNTGALMAIARFVLKTLPGIDRPAIASQLPTKSGETTRARPRRQRQLHAGTAGAVRRDGQRARHRRRRHRAADGGPAEHRRGRHQGQRCRQGNGRAAEGFGRSITTATSKATTSTWARPMSWFATDSSAT